MKKKKKKKQQEGKKKEEQKEKEEKKEEEKGTISLALAVHQDLSKSLSCIEEYFII